MTLIWVASEAWIVFSSFSLRQGGSTTLMTSIEEKFIKCYRKWTLQYTRKANKSEFYLLFSFESLSNIMILLAVSTKLIVT